MINILVKQTQGFFIFLMTTLALVLTISPIIQADSPTEIYTIDDLWNIRNDLSGYYILMNDLDFENNGHYVDWAVSKNENTTGYGWLPIGVYDDEFTGTFDGQNYTISNLFVDRDDDAGIGLFGYTLNSTIKNINLIDVDVTGYYSVGGLIGFNMGSISKCSATGSVTGVYYVGGLIGDNWKSYILKSHAAVQVQGETSVGGLIGSNIESLVEQSYAKEDVNGLTDDDNDMGGLIGYNDGNITDCYATGDVVSEGEYSWYIGGLVGENDGGSIADCYSNGYVDGNDVVGGLIGSNTGMVENCFWDEQTSGQDSSDGGTGKTTSEMKNFDTFNDSGWDIAKIEDFFDETWFINHTVDYPRLGWEPTSASNNPPNDPSCLSPINHATNISINATLNWLCTDPDGDPLTFDVYFGTSSSPPKVKSNQSETSYNPGTMNFNTTYYWKIVAWDNHSASTVSLIWDFTTKVNSPPNPPDYPDPPNHNTSVDINDELIWLGGDPDSGDTVTYDVYFGTTNTPPKVKSNQSGNTYNPGTMNFSTKYYWKIVAWDNHGFSTTGNLWDFTTTIYVNYPPNIPNNPTPPNNKTNININQDLYWDGGDLNSNDTVTYDIYFGTSNPPEFKEAIGPYPASQTSISYNPGTMNYNTKYYWKIIAWDNHGNSSTGPIWSFTTGAKPPDGGSGGGSPFIPPNKAPIADASASENSGFVNTAVKFNGSYSYDEDGEITNYTWGFGDNSYGYGIFATHIYEKADVYNVKLTVTDDKGVSDTDSFKVIISQPNNPPTIPQIDGPKIGKQNIEYNFTVFSTDADNDNIQYVFYWGDDQIDETDFLPNGTISIEKHKWTSAGIYKIRVVAIDSNYKSSASAEINILIDVLYCKNIGYFIDENSNGTYDTFYSNATGLLTDLIYQDGEYLIDTDGDGIENYIYNIGTDALTKIKTPEEETPEYVILYILPLLIIVILIIIIMIAKRPKQKAEEEKEKPKKTKPSTKKSKAQKKGKTTKKKKNVKRKKSKKSKKK